MRTAAFACVFMLAWAGMAAAQEVPDWTEYQNIPDGFKVAFPGQPRVTNTVWTTEYGYKAPAHVYSAERGREKYSVTVVDYNAIEPQGVERRKNCPPGAEPCIGSDISGPGYWRHDIRGAMIFATKQYLQKNVTMTNYTWQHQDLVEGAELQLTSNTDQARTFVFIAMHENKLYIFDGTVPKGYPQPGLFQQSVGFVDAEGRGIRYQTMYSNEIYGLKEREKPTYGGGGGGGAAGGRGGRGGGGQGQGGGRAGGNQPQ